MKLAGVAAGLVLAGFCIAPGAEAAAFKSFSECTIGRRVATDSNQTGVITGNSTSASICNVRMDAGGDTHYFLFWMLHDAGGSAETDDKLVPGKYACRSFSGGQMSYDFMDVIIAGPTTYQSGGGTYSFRLDARSRQITFLNGPLAGHPAKLTDGPTIQFAATSCRLER